MSAVNEGSKSIQEKKEELVPPPALSKYIEHLNCFEDDLDMDDDFELDPNGNSNLDANGNNNNNSNISNISNNSNDGLSSVGAMYTLKKRAGPLSELIEKAKRNSLPEVNRKSYLKEYNNYEHFCVNYELALGEQDSLILWGQLLKDEGFVPSSVWTKVSKVKNVIRSEFGINTKSWSRLHAWLVNNSKYYVGTKKPSFEEHQVKRFLSDADDSFYLREKCTLSFGLGGRLRSSDYPNLVWENVTILKNEKDGSTVLEVTHIKSKTKEHIRFLIIGAFVKPVLLYKDTTVRFHNGKGRIFRQTKLLKGQVHHVASVLGKGYFQSIAPRTIAKWMVLSNCECFTGHSLCRTAATIFANTGASVTQMKKRGGWKSVSVAESYVDASVPSKMDAARRVFGVENSGVGQDV